MGRRKIRRRRAGYVRELRSGVWEVSIDVGRDSAGRRRRVHRTVHGNRDDAEREVARLIEQTERLGGVAPGSVQLEEFVKQWAETIVPVSGRVRARTAAGYLGHLRRYVLPALGSQRLRSIATHDVEHLAIALEKERGISGLTVRHAMTALRSVFREAVRLGIADRNPVAGANLPHARPTQRAVWSASEAQRFLAATSDSRWCAAWRILLVLGLRPSELRGLTWDDVDLEHDSISVNRSTTWDQEHRCWSTSPPKTECSRRSLPLDQATAAAIASWRAAQASEKLRTGEGWGTPESEADGRLRVFLTHDGRLLSDWALREALHADADRARVPKVSPYCLRHTSATLAFAAGVDLLVISRRLGHSTISTTANTYTRVQQQAQEDATDALSGILSAP